MQTEAASIHGAGRGNEFSNSPSSCCILPNVLKSAPEGTPTPPNVPQLIFRIVCKAAIGIERAAAGGCEVVLILPIMITQCRQGSPLAKAMKAVGLGPATWEGPDQTPHHPTSSNTHFINVEAVVSMSYPASSPLHNVFCK